MLILKCENKPTINLNEHSGCIELLCENEGNCTKEENPYCFNVDCFDVHFWDLPGELKTLFQEEWEDQLYHDLCPECIDYTKGRKKGESQRCIGCWPEQGTLGYFRDKHTRDCSNCVEQTGSAYKEACHKCRAVKCETGVYPDWKPNKEWAEKL